MEKYPVIQCPVCGNNLQPCGNSVRCQQGHCFDIAKEGYINLLRTTKSGDKIGDDKFSARSRRDFLNKGYYQILRNHLQELFSNRSGRLLDICCGEGYYTSALAHDSLDVYGFDISKEMVRLAAKRGNGTYFVANMAVIPVGDASFEFATHLFAPFQEAEFARILKPNGRLFTVIPGKFHLFGLKKALYDTPYENDEKLPETKRLTLVNTTKLQSNIRLSNAEDIEAVFRMTPYYFHTSTQDRQKLSTLEFLDTPIEFVVAEYKKEGQ